MTRMIEINENGDTVPVILDKLNDVNVISVNGEVWAVTPDRKRATILFNMIVDHVTEYSEFKKKD